MSVAHRHGNGVHPTMDAYLQNSDEPSTARRLAENSTLPVVNTNLGGSSRRTAWSDARTSMLPMTRSNGSLAALTTRSSAPTVTSVSTSFGGRTLVAPRILEPDGDGALQLAPLRNPPIYECPFNHILCLLTFTSFNEWLAHSLTHFQGYSPPRSASCCFCDLTFVAPSGTQCWRDRMEHVELHHRLGHNLAHARLDFDLYRHLWQNKLITDLTFRDLTAYPGSSGAESAYPSPPISPAESTAYTVPHDSRRRRPRRT